MISLRENNDIEIITPQDVDNLLKEGKEISLIDVREYEEVAHGKIPQAKHIRLHEIPDRLEEIEKDREHIFICHSGGRSENACLYLQDLGYKVRNMVGGMKNWKGETV